MLFTFPSRYWFTIGHQVVFSLRRWSSQIPTGFHVPRSTRVRLPERQHIFVYKAFTSYGGAFQPASTNMLLCNSPRRMQSSPKPTHDPSQATSADLTLDWFRLFPVRSPLLRESLLLYFPRATEMVHFAPFAPPTLFYSDGGDMTSSCRVASFGHLRIIARLQLPEAFRSLSRPSSPPDA